MLLRHLNYFLAVAQYQSFTRAARALHVSQPALSQQVRQLEEHLGAQLFDRTGRLVRLTDAGEVYLRYARQALQDLEEGRRALHDVSDLSRGSLRVAVAPAMAALPSRATVAARSDRPLASRAELALCSTVLVSSSMDAAVSSRLLACDSVRADRSWLPLAISLDATCTPSTSRRTSETTA